jgi:hypothetical protein
MAIGYGYRVPDPTGLGKGTIFDLRVALVPDPNRDGYGEGIFSHLWVTHRVPEFSPYKISPQITLKI